MKREYIFPCMTEASSVAYSTVGAENGSIMAASCKESNHSIIITESSTVST